MRVLWVKTDILHPIDKGGKIRSYEMLRELKKTCDVSYLALRRDVDTGENLDRAALYCHRLITVPHAETPKFSRAFYGDLARAAVSTLPYTILKYRSPAACHALVQELRARPYDVVIADFLHAAAFFPSPAELRAIAPDTATVLFQHNVESKLWERQWKNATDPARKAYFYLEWKKVRAYEARKCKQFDLVVAVSEVDRETMQREFGLAECPDVPTGVDTDTMRPGGATERPRELCFTGSMDWMPNEDAMEWFAEAILPRIARELPDVTLACVGRNPTPRMLALARREPRITMTGRVDDIRPYVDRAACYVIPIRVGGGTRLKVYEAMAMGKAIVSTRVGAEGLPVTHERDILFADDPESFARETVRVLRERDLAGRLGTTARQLVVDRFGWGAVNTKFLAALERAVELHRGGAGARAA